MPENFGYFFTHCCLILRKRRCLLLLTSFFLTLNQTKVTNFTTNGREISLFRTCFHLIDSSHSIFDKNGCCLIAKPHLKISNYFIYPIVLYIR